MPEWLVSIVVGFASGGLSAYLGLKIGQAKLEWQMESAQDDLDVLRKRSHTQNEDLLIHDLELDDVMRKLDIPRKKRQNWRFE